MLPGVSQTAILTLRARVDEHARADRVLHDPLAAEWWRRVEWPRELDAWYARQAGLAYRAHDLDCLIRALADRGPVSTLVELGAGLSTRFDRLRDLGVRRWIDVDLPPVAALRASWGAEPEQLGRSVLDHGWMDALDDPRGLVFVLEGLLYYLPRAEVDALFGALARRFPGAAVVMDVLGVTDYPRLRAETEAIGSPIAWCHSGRFDDALAAHGLEPIEGLEPSVTTDAALRRYWHRLDEPTRGAIYVARHSEPLWQLRSGNVIGRLTAR